MSKVFSFEVTGTSIEKGCAGRTGVLKHGHGQMETPAFMPVGTQATVKGLLPEQVAGAGYNMILGNTYHLELRPGSSDIARAGGLHRFMGWDRGILTDSGGFQVFSLAHRRKIDRDGVTFRSHVDGVEVRFSPESVIKAQENLGSDIAMVLDVCPPSTAGADEIDQAMETTSRWARMALTARTREDQAVFAIVQGGLDINRRRQHAADLSPLGFEGFAIGGLSVGEPPHLMIPAAAATAAVLPADKPRYLMGVGKPPDLARCVQGGVDMFDCVYPTRSGRNGHYLTFNGIVSIKNSAYRNDDRPVEADCDCPVCTRYSRSYLRHLYMSKEILASVLNTWHNLWFYERLMKRIRLAVREGTLEELASAIDSVYPRETGDDEMELAKPE